MPSDAPELIIEINDPQLDGLSAPGRVQPLDPLHWTRDCVAKRRIRIQRDGRDVDLTGATLASAVGIPDSAATSGTFTIQYGANTTTALNWNADAATVQAALVALASIGVGGVTVINVGSLYKVSWTAVGARTALIIDGSLLQPPITPWILESTTGDGSTKEVQLFSITQTPLAYSDDWTLHQGGTATSTQDFAGDFSGPARYTIEFDPAPSGGVLAMSCAVQEVTLVAFSGATGADADGTWFTLCDHIGLVGFWISDTTTTSPPAELLALAIRQAVKVNVINTDNTSQVNDAIEAALAFWTASFTVISTTGDVPIEVENVFDGERTPPSADSSGMIAVAVGASGFSASAVISIGASASEIANALGQDFNVTVGEDNKLSLIATTNRALPNFTLDDTGVAYPDYFEGTMAFDQIALEFAMAALAASAPFLVCITEFQLTRASSEADCILQYPSWAYRNLIRRGANYNGSGISGDPVVTGNTLWVDEIYGTASGVAYRQDRQYSTPSLAKAAATSGDTIIVRPGNYTTTTNLAKAGVSWFFETGATLDKTDGADNLAMFDDAGAAMVFDIMGSGKFTVSAGSGTNRFILKNNHVDSVVYFDGLTADAPTDAFLCEAGIQNIKCRTVIAGDFAFATTGANANQTVTADDVTAGDNAIYCSLGTQNAVCNKVTGVNSVCYLGGGTQYANVLNGICTGASGTAIFLGDDDAGGAGNYVGRFASTNSNRDAIGINDDAKTLKIYGIFIATGTGDSIKNISGAPAAVSAFGAYTNKALDAGVTANGITVNAAVT